MYTKIYQNSYVILVITFVLLSLFFYFFEIGFSTQIVNGKVVKKFSWKYPLAISLIVWLFWHFYLYPPRETPKPSSKPATLTINNNTSDAIIGMKSRSLAAQKITMANWN